MIHLLFSPDGFLITAIGLLAVTLCVLPVLDRRRAQAGPEPRDQMVMFGQTIVLLWGLAALCVAGWLLSGRPLSEIGWRPASADWGGALAWSIAAAVLAYCAYQIGMTWFSARSRASVREQLKHVDLERVRPHTRDEAVTFQALSVTAGVTEEVIFRGVLLTAISLVAPLWAAVLISLVAFILPHAYQGLGGLLRVAPTGVVLTGIVLLGGSLWPAILAHMAIDMTAGATFAILDRFKAQDEAKSADLLGAPPAP
jgi:membrane protease YdiL (CAAX protease family)